MERRGVVLFLLLFHHALSPLLRGVSPRCRLTPLDFLAEFALLTVGDNSASALATPNNSIDVAAVRNMAQGERDGTFCLCFVFAVFLHKCFVCPVRGVSNTRDTARLHAQCKSSVMGALGPCTSAAG